MMFPTEHGDFLLYQRVICFTIHRFYTSQVILWLQIRITLDHQQKSPEFDGIPTEVGGLAQRFSQDVQERHIALKGREENLMEISNGCHFGFQGGFSEVVAKITWLWYIQKSSLQHTEICNIFLTFVIPRHFPTWHQTSVYFLFLFPTKKRVRKYHQRFQSSTNPSESVWFDAPSWWFVWPPAMPTHFPKEMKGLRKGWGMIPSLHNPLVKLLFPGRCGVWEVGPLKPSQKWRRKVSSFIFARYIRAILSSEHLLRQQAIQLFTQLDRDATLGWCLRDFLSSLDYPPWN